MGNVAFLIGLLAAPLLALRLGRRLRDRPDVHRRIFWGAVIGHTCGMAITFALALVPPVWWQGGPAWRTVSVHWSMLLGTLVGLAIALARGLGGSAHRARH